MEGEKLGRSTDGLRAPLPSEVVVVPWVDELVEEHGFGPRSMYVEMCWLPVLGPTATWLYRRLGSWAEFNPDGVAVDMTDLSRSLGLGSGLAHNSHAAKAISRLERFNAVRWAAGRLLVRRALAPLPQRYLETLTPNTQRLHDAYTRKSKSSAAGGAK
jgi:hypothetical protein